MTDIQRLELSCQLKEAEEEEVAPTIGHEHIECSIANLFQQGPDDEDSNTVAGGLESVGDRQDEDNRSREAEYGNACVCATRDAWHRRV